MTLLPALLGKVLEYIRPPRGFPRWYKYHKLQTIHERIDRCTDQVGDHENPVRNVDLLLMDETHDLLREAYSWYAEVEPGSPEGGTHEETLRPQGYLRSRVEGSEVRRS